MAQKRAIVEVPEEIPMIQVLGVNDANLHNWEDDFPTLNFWVAGNQIFIQGPDVDLEPATRLVRALFTKPHIEKQNIPDYGLQINRHARGARWRSRQPGLLTPGIGLCSSAVKKSFVPKPRAKPGT